jgi:hypothetical protein
LQQWSEKNLVERSDRFSYDLSQLVAINDSFTPLDGKSQHTINKPADFPVK